VGGRGATGAATARRELSAAIDAGKRAYTEEKRRTESTNVLNQAPPTNRRDLNDCELRNRIKESDCLSIRIAAIEESANRNLMSLLAFQ
jgi:hypothetical protein